jgi:hypothetical protein
MFLKGVNYNYVEGKPEIFHAWPEYSEIYWLRTWTYYDRRNVCKYLPVDTSQHPRKIEFSALDLLLQLNTWLPIFILWNLAIKLFFSTCHFKLVFQQLASFPCSIIFKSRLWNCLFCAGVLPRLHKPQLINPKKVPKAGYVQFPPQPL